MTQNGHMGSIPQLCRAISSQLRHVSTSGKNLLNRNVSPTCPHNMVNSGPLAAEICWRVWDRCKFQQVSRLGSDTAQYSGSGRQPNFAALNRERHLYSPGRPSSWASAHILVCLGLVIPRRVGRSSSTSWLYDVTVTRSAATGVCGHRTQVSAISTLSTRNVGQCPTRWPP